MRTLRRGWVMIVAVGALAVLPPALVDAGPPDAPAGPDDAASAMYTLESIYQRLSTGAAGAKRITPFAEPSAGPGTGTMHTLNDIMAQAPAANAAGLTPGEVPAGADFWCLAGGTWGVRAGTRLPAGDLVDTDPVVGNLRGVPAGVFRQGSPETEPGRDADETQFTHRLTLNLAVMETEVTRQMWADLKTYWDGDPDLAKKLPADPTDPAHGSGMSNPVQNLTWFQAVLFANLLSFKNGLTPCYYADAAFDTPIDASNYTGSVYCDWSVDGFRLLTEGEWEYGCRAGSVTPFWLDEPGYVEGNDDKCPPSPAMLSLDLIAVYCNSGADPTQPVGSKPANPWGLKDVHGNVAEWCWDWSGAYPAGSATDYRGPASVAPGSEYRIYRGGGFGTHALYVRSASRTAGAPGSTVFNLGFRLARAR